MDASEDLLVVNKGLALGVSIRIDPDWNCDPGNGQFDPIPATSRIDSCRHMWPATSFHVARELFKITSV